MDNISNEPACKYFFVTSSGAPRAAPSSVGFCCSPHLSLNQIAKCFDFDADAFHCEQAGLYASLLDGYL